MRVPSGSGLFLGILASLLIATFGVNTMPLLVGAAVKGLRLNAANAGLLASFELGAVAVSCLYLANKVARVSIRRIGLYGGSVAILGHAGALLASPLAELVGLPTLQLNDQILVGPYVPLACTRMVAGLGEGAALAAFGAAIARTSNPDRTDAQVLMLNVAIIGAVTAALIPPLARQYAYAGAYSSLAIASMACVPFLIGLPSDSAEESRPDAPPANKVHGVMLLASLGVFAMGEGAVWAFAERIGAKMGASEEQLARSIAIGSTLGVFIGASIVAIIGKMFGRAIPTILGVALFGATGLAFSWSTSIKLYMPLICLLTAALYFVLPLYLGAATELDSHGRWSSGISGIYLLGNTLGPPVAGHLIDRSVSFESLGWFVLATSLLPVLPTLAVMRKAAVD